MRKKNQFSSFSKKDKFLIANIYVYVYIKFMQYFYKIYIKIQKQ